MAAQLGFDQLTREARQVVDAVAAGVAVNGLHDGLGERIGVAAQVLDERTLALAEVAVYNALHAGKTLDVGEEQLLLRGAFAAVVEQQGQDALAVERTLSAGRGRLRRDGEPFLRQTAAVQAVTRLEHRVAVFDLVLKVVAALAVPTHIRIGCVGIVTDDKLCTPDSTALDDFIVLIGAFFFVHKHLSILWHNADRLFRPWLSFFAQGDSLQALDAVPAACGVSC